MNTNVRKFNVDIFNDYVDEVKRICESKNLMGQINKILSDSWKEIDDGLTKSCKEAAHHKFSSQPIQASINYLSQFTRDLDINAIVKDVPEKKCSEQVVLGLSEHIAPYFMYNQEISDGEKKFLILADQNWNNEGNNLYIRCAIYSVLSNCKYPVRILLPKDKNALFKNNETEPRVTIFELFSLQEIFNQELNSFIPTEYQLSNNLFTTMEDDPTLPYTIIFIRNPYYRKSPQELINENVPIDGNLPFINTASYFNKFIKSIHQKPSKTLGKTLGKTPSKMPGKTKITSNSWEALLNESLDKYPEPSNTFLNPKTILKEYKNNITSKNSLLNKKDSGYGNKYLKKKQHLEENKIKTGMGGYFSRKTRKRTRINRRGKRTYINIKKRKHKTQRQPLRMA